MSVEELNFFDQEGTTAPSIKEIHKKEEMPPLGKIIDDEKFMKTQVTRKILYYVPKQD